MIGLEKVTGKILADAEADARETLARADERGEEIAADYRARTAIECDRLREAGDRECQALIVRAKSSAVMARRNALIEARSAVLETAYAAAERQIRSMTGEPYLELLSKMLRTALKSQLEAEEDSLRLYGEDISPAAYEVILSPRDRVAYGKRLMEGFRHGLGARFPATALAKLTLAPEPVTADGVSVEHATIDGGLVLRCGAIEINCSLSMLLAQNRRETEARVSRILFGEGDERTDA